MVSQQERFLNDALRFDSPTDFIELHSGFEGFVSVAEWDRLGPQPETTELSNQLEQSYRIRLMGLAGRAIQLADSGTVADTTPYLDIVRQKHGQPENLGEDVALALEDLTMLTTPLWLEWASENVNLGTTAGVNPERYPLTWFAVRLMELATEPLQPLNLRGSAWRVRKWFEDNAAALEPYVNDVATGAIGKRRALVSDALRVAEITDAE